MTSNVRAKITVENLEIHNLYMYGARQSAVRCFSDVASFPWLSQLAPDRGAFLFYFIYLFSSLIFSELRCVYFRFSLPR